MRGHLPLPGRRRSAEHWHRAVDRLERAVNRYGAQASTLPERAIRHEVLFLGEDLQHALDDIVRAGDERGAARAGRDPRLLEAVQRAATLCAHATEAALTAHDAARRGERDATVRHLDALRLLVKGVRELADAVRTDP